MADKITKQTQFYKSTTPTIEAPISENVSTSLEEGAQPNVRIEKMGTFIYETPEGEIIQLKGAVKSASSWASVKG